MANPLIPHSVLGVKTNTCFLMLGIYFIIIFIISIIVLSIPDWISQNDDAKGYQEQWIGSLSKIIDSDDSFEQDSYQKLRNDWCDQAEQQISSYHTNADTFCQMFELLNNGGACYIAFTIISYIGIILIIISMLVTLFYNNIQWLLCIGSFTFILSTFLAFVIAMGCFKVVFDGSCDTIYRDTSITYREPPSTCAQSGATMSLIYFFLAMPGGIVSLIVSINYHKHQKFLHVPNLAQNVQVHQQAPVQGTPVNAFQPNAGFQPVQNVQPAFYPQPMQYPQPGQQPPVQYPQQPAYNYQQPGLPPAYPQIYQQPLQQAYQLPQQTYQPPQQAFQPVYPSQQVNQPYPVAPGPEAGLYPAYPQTPAKLHDPPAPVFVESGWEETKKKEKKEKKEKRKEKRKEKKEKKKKRSKIPDGSSDND